MSTKTQHNAQSSFFFLPMVWPAACQGFDPRRAQQAQQPQNSFVCVGLICVDLPPNNEVNFISDDDDGENKLHGDADGEENTDAENAKERLVAQKMRNQ